jgi:serine/threonine protein kinase
MVPENSPATGELLDGRYLLDSRIGEGGMGVVYRARDETLGRTVAVKIFRESAMDAARTTSETRLLAALNHPSLVTLFEAETGAGRPNYLVMEYVEGPTLRERISDGPLAPADVAAMARDLAEALHVVHDAGVVHRDIKPSNVLLRRSPVPGEEYRAKLADFGIAYLIDPNRLTTPGTLVGTAAYLSPEQVRGEEPAPASDIYALGLVLVEALTGTRAFAQTGVHEAALARLSRDPDIPGTLGYAWKSLLTAMTTRDPAQRPTALEVVVAATGLNDTTRRDVPEMTSTPAATAGITVRLSADAAPTRTLKMPASDLTQPTIRFEKPADNSASVAADRSGPRSRIRRWQVIVAVVILVVVVVFVGMLISSLGATAPTDAPALPTLEGPVSTHMQDLMEAVTP